MGILALDIDGTITGKDHRIPSRVVDFLGEKIKEGWALVLVTGRTLTYACCAVDALPFSYTLICQNGANAFEMPSKTLCAEQYMSKETVLGVDALAPSLVYSGYASGDFCYYRPDRFSSDDMRPYFAKLEQLSAAPWVAITSWDEVQQERFPLIKCVGTKKHLREIEKEIHHTSEVETSIIHDPIDEAYHLILITHRDAQKGKALARIIDAKRLVGPIIAAGDDENDISLLRKADVAIAMSGAPEALQAVAAIHADEQGIIPAITEAICTL